MGMFQKRVKVSNPMDSSKSFEADFWIDTWALYSCIPQSFLEKIDFEPEGISDKIIYPVIAGSEGSLFLLGATALENFGVEADPVNKELKPIFAIIVGFVGSI